MIRRPPRSTRKESSAASDVYKRQQKAGVKHFKWEGHDKKSELVSSGVYLFQISDGESVKRMKMILLK